MKIRYLNSLLLAWLVSSCGTVSEKDTLASLDKVQIDIKEERIEGSLDKAMESYRRFLEETPESALTPEAIRRLADLKVEKEYGVITDEPVAKTAAPTAAQTPETAIAPVAPSAAPEVAGAATALIAGDNEDHKQQTRAQSIADVSESQKEFENRATKKQDIKSSDSKLDAPPGASADELQTAGALEAIELYKGLLVKYPLYERNDQVLYQLSRAYEETGQIEQAVEVLKRLVKDYPTSRHIDEAYFRLAEYYFTRKRYIDAEESYGAVIKFGLSSAFYEFALYKQGWAFFKQELYEEALNDFIALLDYKVSIGFDFDNIQDKIEQKRIEDTYRVISLGFSYLGGPEAVVDYFDRKGQREYEASIYSHLGEYYLTKRRYADAALSYNTYVERNPLNKVSPYFHIRVIEIYLEGGFPKLVIDAKKNFATTYGLRATYWTFFDINAYPEVVLFLKQNLTDLANHYHALYQNKKLAKFKRENFEEAKHWYREYLASFPEDEQAPTINFQLAELLLENKDYRDAALEYERTSYNYPAHEKSAAAGYAAVYAYREFLKIAQQHERAVVKREVIRSSLKFADAYPQHEKAPDVMVAAIDDLYSLKDYQLAVFTGRKMLETYPDANKKLRRSAWIVVAHGSFDLTNYKDAEEGYSQVLRLTDKDDKTRVDFIENLAASIYKQGEQARLLEDYKTAAHHFLRVATVTPTAKIRPTAEYDGAAALITLKDWPKAAEVLEAFRKRYPKHELQTDVTKKLAIVYKEDKKYLQAAAEFERIETESKDDNIRREALLQAAELYELAEDKDKALSVYQKYVKYFPRPVEFALETRQKIADIYKLKGDDKQYIAELEIIVKTDARAGGERTDRTRFLAANAALVLAKPLLDRYMAVKLVKPFKKNLNRKNQLMKEAIGAYTKLVDYEVGRVTAAATYNIAEIYFHFSRALMGSERPDNLNALELEQYNLAIEEQAYPFEEKAIKVHEKNMELLGVGIYNEWIDNSLEKLAVLVPARYAKPEIGSEFVETIIPVQKLEAPAAPESQPLSAPVPQEQPDAAPASKETAGL